MDDWSVKGERRTTAQANQPKGVTEPSTPKPGTMNEGPTTAHKPKSRKRILISLLILIVIIIGGLVLGYKNYSNDKFVELTKQIKQQEIDGAKSVVTVTDQLNSVSKAYDAASNSSDISGVADLKSKLSDLSTDVKKACDSEKSELNSVTLKNKTTHLWLTSTQKTYIAQQSDVLKMLEASDYSSAGICRDGSLVAAFYQNFANYLPGLITLGKLNQSATPATAEQINSLQQYTTYSISEEGKLRSKLPKTTKVLDDVQVILANAYYALKAQNENRAQDAQSYSDKITAASNDLNKDQANIDPELKSLDDESNNAAINASLDELKVQNSVKNKGFDTVGLTLPAFRIMDSTISKYGGGHDSKYPATSTISALVSALKDKNIDSLNSQKLLSGFSYSSIGSDSSGYSLSATLEDGTVLTNKSLPN